MFYYLYQITNLVNNKIYVGVHKTMDMNDGYMGSGTVIHRAIKKHGIGNFQKDILEIFEDSESMYAREKEIVTEEFLSRDDVYNLRRGGHGGFDYINSNPEKYLTEKRLSTLMTSKERNARWKEKWDNDPEFRKQQKEYAKRGNVAALFKYPKGIWFGRKHSQESIDKMKDASVGRGIGETNSQFGTIWITDDIENKKINKSATIPDGWRRGRILK